jgi:hypothetical protein
MEKAHTLAAALQVATHAYHAGALPDAVAVLRAALPLARTLDDAIALAEAIDTILDDLLLFPPPVPGVAAARRELEALAEAVMLRADDLRILYGRRN